MQVSYTISKDSKEIGPFTVDQILLALSAGEIAVTDYIYVDNDWTPILEFQPVISKLKSNKPKSAPKSEVTKTQAVSPKLQESTEEWFLLREDKKIGPFSYLEVVKMLQDKQAYEFDFTWHENLAKWTRIAELREFSPERMHSLMQEHKDLFVKRQHKRAVYNSEVIVSDHYELFQGTCIQISEGGARLKIAHSMLSPGDRIVIHHKETDHLPPFNAECEIVNKAYSQLLKNKKQEVEYIVTFEKLNDTALKCIKDYAKKVS